jgi:hypothetical protein
MRIVANPKLGALLVTCSEVMVWVSISNYAIILLLGWNSYQDKIVAYLPWMNIWLMLLFAVTPLVILIFMAFLILIPSRLKYMNDQAYKSNSPQMAVNKKILKNQKKIMDRMGIR